MLYAMISRAGSRRQPYAWFRIYDQKIGDVTRTHRQCALYDDKEDAKYGDESNPQMHAGDVRIEGWCVIVDSNIDKLLLDVDAAITSTPLDIQCIDDYADDIICAVKCALSLDVSAN